MVEKLTPERLEPGTDYKEYSPKFKEFMERSAISTLRSEYNAHLEFEKKLSDADDPDKLERLIEDIERGESIAGPAPSTGLMRMMAMHKRDLIKAEQREVADVKFERLNIARVANEIETATTAEELEEIKERLDGAGKLFRANAIFSDLHSYAILIGFEKFRS